MASKIPEAAQYLSDMLSDLTGDHAGVTQEEEDNFVANFLPNQDRQPKFTYTGGWIKFLIAIGLIGWAISYLF